MSNPFIAIDIAPGYYPGRIVTWKLDPVFKDDLPYSFTLEMSEDPAFKEINWSKAVEDNFYALDDSRTIQSFTQRVVYRVRLNTGSGNEYFSPSIFYDGGAEENLKYLYAAEIIRKELLRSTRGGQPGWVIKKKNYSALIADELDPVSGVPISDNKQSFGTKFKGGYYEPLKLQYTTEDHNDEVQMSQDGSGVNHLSTATFRFIGFPSVDVHDILAARDGTRYNIQKTKTRYFPGTNIILVQNCNGVAIPPTDPVYSIEVK